MRDLYTFIDNFKKYDCVRSDLVIEGHVVEPEISVFIPTFNRPNTLRETIDSIILQKCSVNYEIVIVCNNPKGKTGDTYDLIRSYSDDRLYFYVNQENIGLCGNWNRGLELSRAKYVAMIHDDDVLSPWFLESMIKAIRENKEPDIIGVDYCIFNSDHMPVFIEPRNLEYRAVTKRSFFFGKYINIAGITVKKESLFRLGGYSEDYYPNEDSNLIYQTLLYGRVINIEHQLAGYRRESNLTLMGNTLFQIITLVEETRRCIADHEEFAKQWMDKFDIEYLYQYIQGANEYWGINIDYIDVFNQFGIIDKPNEEKLLMMNTLLNEERRTS